MQFACLYVVARAIACVGFAAVAAVALSSCGGGTPGTIKVEILSSPAHLVSGGSALILVSGTAAADSVTVLLNGNDVTSAFKLNSVNGTQIGVVPGLINGQNTVVAKAPGASDTLALTNYPITGPITSGPHLAPLTCQTATFTLPDGAKLGLPTDANCSAPTNIQYVYMATGATAFKPLASIATVPTDVVKTTTTLGTAVNFIVRVETATIDRGIYQSFVLYDPTSEAALSPLNPPKGWNKRLIGQHGSGCAGGWYLQGGAQGVNLLAGDNITRLGEGYAMFINTLNHPTNSCNAVLAGEATMMGKAHFIKTIGVPYYTVSSGCSGGAYSSAQIADAFPGLFDGALISCTFPDALSISLSALDARLLSKYFLTNNGTGITEAQIVAVSGHKNARAWYDLALQSGRTDPVSGRVDPIPTSPLLGKYNSAVWNAAVPVAARYDAVTNPTGARPTVFDVARNIYGIDPATKFALRPFDNVGVQYGLAALNARVISSAQFIELNQRIGGYDQDANYVSGRSIGDAGAIKRVQQSGLALGGNGGLAAIPVLDYSGIFDDDQFYHYQAFHFALRERMLLANGDTKNHVMWRGAAPITQLLGTTTPEGTAINALATTQGWKTFIQWVEAARADVSTASARDKVINNKPASAVDGCFSKGSTTPTFIAEAQTLSSLPATQCNQMWPSYTLPRKEAGGPLAANIYKCQLKPIIAADYAVTFTAAELAQLATVFPGGVCDWSKQGVNQSGVVPWASFGPSPTNLLFDVSKP